MRVKTKRTYWLRQTFDERGVLIEQIPFEKVEVFIVENTGKRMLKVLKQKWLSALSVVVLFSVALSPREGMDFGIWVLLCLSIFYHLLSIVEAGLKEFND